MPKAVQKKPVLTTSERVRRLEANKRAQGLREIRVWVPDDDVSAERVRAVARTLCALKGAVESGD